MPCLAGGLFELRLLGSSQAGHVARMHGCLVCISCHHPPPSPSVSTDVGTSLLATAAVRRPAAAVAERRVRCRRPCAPAAQASATLLPRCHFCCLCITGKNFVFHSDQALQSKSVAPCLLRPALILKCMACREQPQACRCLRPSRRPFLQVAARAAHRVLLGGLFQPGPAGAGATGGHARGRG